MSDKRMDLDEMFKFWGVEGSDNKKLLNFLIQSDEELSLFMDKFYTGHILKNMMAYKKHKREQNSMSREEFVTMMKLDTKQALEQLAQEPVNSDTHIIEYMSRSNVSYIEIYNKHKLYPHERIENIVTGNYITTLNSPDSFQIVLQ